MSEQVFPVELNQQLPRAVRWSGTAWLLIVVGFFFFLDFICNFCAALFDIYARGMASRTKSLDVWWALVQSHLTFDFFFNLFFVGAMAWICKEMYKERTLSKRGVPVPAVILREEEYSGGKGGRRMKAFYQFTNNVGEAFQGVREDLPTRSGKREDIQAFLTKMLENPIVLYDPQNPKRSMLYPGRFVVCYLPQGR